MQRFFLVAGTLMIAAGLAWPWLSKLPLGHLPGDISIERENFNFYFPVTTCILISLIIGFLIWLFRR